MAIKILLTAGFIIIETIVFFLAIVFLNKHLDKIGSEYTEIGLLLTSFIFAIFYLGILISFIFYLLANERTRNPTQLSHQDVMEALGKV